MRKIITFYSNPLNLEQFMDIVLPDRDREDKQVSLRIVDWFITNYSKKNNIVYSITRPSGRVENFSVYQSYRGMVNSYPKKLFDSFCRGDLLEFEVNGQRVETAVCQLHLFKWAIENLVITYIQQHYDDIYQDLKQNGSRSNQNQVKKTKQQLSRSVYQKLVCGNQPVSLSFGQKN